MKYAEAFNKQFFIPDYTRAIEMASNTQAPSDGLAIAYAYNISVTQTINGIGVGICSYIPNAFTGNLNVQTLVKKGDKCGPVAWRFCPFLGNG